MLVTCPLCPALSCVAGEAAPSLSLEVPKQGWSVGNRKRTGQADLDLKAQAPWLELLTPPSLILSVKCECFAWSYFEHPRAPFTETPTNAQHSVPGSFVSNFRRVPMFLLESWAASFVDSMRDSILIVPRHCGYSEPASKWLYPLQ